MKHVNCLNPVTLFEPVGGGGFCLMKIFVFLKFEPLQIEKISQRGGGVDPLFLNTPFDLSLWKSGEGEQQLIAKTQVKIKFCFFQLLHELFFNFALLMILSDSLWFIHK